MALHRDAGAELRHGAEDLGDLRRAPLERERPALDVRVVEQIRDESRHGRRRSLDRRRVPLHARLLRSVDAEQARRVEPDGTQRVPQIVRHDREHVLHRPRRALCFPEQERVVDRDAGAAPDQLRELLVDAREPPLAEGRERDGAEDLLPRHDGRHDQRAQVAAEEARRFAQVALDRIVQLAHTGPQHVGDAEGILEVRGLYPAVSWDPHALRRIAWRAR